MAIDLSKLRGLVKRLEALERDEIRVGVFEGRYGPENDNLPVAQVAMYNEYGTHTIPSRPFMHRTFEDKAVLREIMKGYKKSAQNILKGLRHEDVLHRVGFKLSEEMKEMLDGYGGSNAASTIARKGFNKPLYETGLLLESITFKIERKGAL